MITVTLTRLNENTPFLTTTAQSAEGVIHSAMRAYSDERGDEYSAKLVEPMGSSRWRLQPGKQLDDGSTSLNSPIIVDVISA